MPASMGIEDMEAAARNHGQDIAATETYRRVGCEHGIFEKVWRVTIWINRPRRQIARQQGMMRGKGSSDEFNDANAGAGQCPVNASDEAKAVGGVRAIEERGLL